MQRALPRGVLWLSSIMSLLALGACKDKEPGKLEGPAGALGAIAAPIELPKEVLVYGGTAVPNKVLGDLSAFIVKVGVPAPPLESMYGPALQGQLRLKTPAAIDAGKPVKFAVFDPNLYFKQDPSAFIIGITGKDAFLQSLPDTRKENDEGNAWSYVRSEGAKVPLYVNFIGDNVVITRDKGLFAAQKAFLERLATTDMPNMGQATVAASHVNGAFGPQIDGALTQLKAQMAEALGANPATASQGQMVIAMIDWAGAAFKDLEEIRGTAIMLDDGLKIAINVRPKADSALAKSVAGLGGDDGRALLAKLPADAPFVMFSQIDPTKLTGFPEMIGQMMSAQVAGADPAKAAEYKAALTEVMSSMTGTFAMAAHNAPGGDGLAISGLMGVKDQARMRAAQDKVVGMYKDPAMVAMMQTSGVAVEIQGAAYSVGDVPVSIMTTKMTNLPPEAMVMTGFLSEMLVQHVAIGKEMGVVAYGTNARATVEGLLNGTLPGGLDKAPGMARALKNAAEKPFFFVYFSPVELGKRVKLGGMNPLVATLAGIEGQTGVAISAGSTGKEMQLVIDLPLETAQKAFQAFEKTKGSF